MTLSIPTNLFLRLQAMLSNPLGQQEQAMRQLKKQLRAEAIQWVQDRVIARSMYLSGKTPLRLLDPDIASYAQLHKDNFDYEMIHYLRSKGLEKEAKIYDERKNVGVRQTTVGKNEDGSLTSETVVSSGGVLSNALELEF